MKTIVFFMMGLVLLLSASVMTAEDIVEAQTNDSTKAVDSVSLKYQGSDRFVIYYLHMNRRCMTCEKLEKYSEEAVSAGFAEQLKV